MRSDEVKILLKLTEKVEHLAGNVDGLHSKVDGVYNRLHETQTAWEARCNEHRQEMDETRKAIRSWVDFRERILWLGRLVRDGVKWGTVGGGALASVYAAAKAVLKLLHHS